MKKTFFIILFLSAIIGTAVYANSTIGVIDPGNYGYYKAALLSDPGFGASDLTINFGKFTDPAVAQYNIIVTSTELHGFAWGGSVGWIVTNCANTTSGCSSTNGNFKVAVSDTGVLSGYAWGQNTGWINFGPFTNPAISQIKIGTDGKFGGTLGNAGYAWGQNIGWIVFDCTNPNTCVQTDFSYVKQSPNPGHPITPPVTPPVVPPVTPPITPPVTPPVVPPVTPPVTPTVTPVAPGSQPVNPPTGGIPSNPSGGGFVIQVPDVIQTIATNISTATRKAVDVSTEATQIAFTSPEGKTIATAVTTTGAAVTTGVSLVSVFALNPLSAAEAFLIPFRLWSLLLGALGIRKRVRKWGVVYDSQTKQPIDPAYVTIFDAQGNEVNSAISDIDGRYGFLLAPGTYTMSAQKTNYAFPSKVLAAHTQDELYDDLYFGEPFTVEKETFVLTKNIPLDPIGFDWNEYVKKSRGLTHFFARHEVLISKITWGFFAFGFLTATLSVFYSPTTYNYAILAFYIVLGILRATGVVGAKTSTIVNKKGDLIPFALVQVYNEAGARIARKVTSVHGRFYCLIPNGTYYMTISTKNAGQDAGYTLAHTTEKFVVKTGFIHKKVVID